MARDRTRSGYRDLPYPKPTSAGASATGRANKRTGTKPETLVRSLLHRRGHRFRKDFPILAGATRVRPDIVFTTCKLAVFIDGCFWHSCPCHRIKPKSNTSYWTPKLGRTVERDRLVNAELAGCGWRTLRIWEHVRPVDAVAEIEAYL